MPAATIDRDLERRLTELKERQGDTVALGQVGLVVSALLDSLRGDLTAADLRVYQELEGLVSYIHAARAEIAQLRPQDIQTEFIPSATDELDAIVDATESATNSILDAVEMVESLAAKAPEELAQQLTDCTTRIYEACNFQDITGQRITKVVKALKHIEDKIEALVTALSGEAAIAKAAAKAPRAEKAVDITNEADLLNGPQLPDKASNQAEIDALFSNSD
ncbi:MAG: protein phosphatase CheZ [Rhodospirillales bacterium]|nr:protein phosphatase CheZ [Rhodospirillales bacterium]